MKKILFCILVLLLATACSKPVKTVAPILEDISFDLDVTYYNENYSLKGETDDSDEMRLTVTEPEELNGMILTIDDGKLNVEYKGLTHSPTNQELFGNAGIIIERIFESAEDKIPKDKSDGNYSISGKAQGKEYTFTFSPSGYPIRLEVPTEGFVAEFSNVTVKRDN
ncbi:MAG: hypothetical protein IKK24_06270 [Clostridia bacterium]|nr:hypothetical protein [Clostridia bacterium]